MKKNLILLLCLLILNISCKKSEYLDKKPIKALLVPTTLLDFQKLLDNPDMNITGELGEIASDDYFIINAASWNSIFNNYARNGYIWQNEIFDGKGNNPDWNILYKQILYANIVLSGLEKYNSHLIETVEYKRIKGWALFIRGFAFFNLAQQFTLPYDRATAKNLLGLPIKLSPNVTEKVPRADLQSTYNQILNDLKESLILLPQKSPGLDRNRPYKITADALLARVYLSMREYNLALLHSNNALQFYDKLIDFNSLSVSANSPITLLNEETLHSDAFTVISSDIIATFRVSANILVDTLLYDSYHSNDLRKEILFGRSTTTGKIGFKGSYYGNTKPFSGLAINELYFTKAECLIRSGDVNAGLEILNKLLINRWKKGTYVQFANLDKDVALNLILKERRKELPFRGIRWLDIRRLNLEGKNIILRRNLDGREHILEPNSPKYAWPIPPDEIQLSGLIQNQR